MAQEELRPADFAELIDDLRTEADLCRNEAADDIAVLLDQAADAIKQAEIAALERQWIRVDVEVPVAGEYVIYHAPGIFEYGPQMWIGQYSEGVFYGKSGFFGGGEVTHWMRLPPLPALIEEARKG